MLPNHICPNTSALKSTFVSCSSVKQYMLYSPQENQQYTVAVIASYCIQTCLIPYLIIFPYVHNPSVHLVNFWELPVDSVPSWIDTSRADLPLACSQHQPRICSLFLQYNKLCGPDYIVSAGPDNNPQSCGQIGF